MNFSEAINIVLNEAESSALGECSSEGAEVLEACEVVNQFIKYLPEEFANDATPNRQKISEYADELKKGFPTGDVDFGTSME
jgi:hypothetical protein